MEKRKRTFLTVREAATIYFDGLISPAALYNLIKRNQIKTVKLGTRILIPIHELEHYTHTQLGDQNNEYPISIQR